MRKLLPLFLAGVLLFAGAYAGLAKLAASQVSPQQRAIAMAVSEYRIWPHLGAYCQTIEGAQKCWTADNMLGYTQAAAQARQNSLLNWLTDWQGDVLSHFLLYVLPFIALYLAYKLLRIYYGVSQFTRWLRA